MEQILTITSSRTMRRNISRSLAAAGFEVEHCTGDWVSIDEALSRGPRMCIIDANGQAEEVSRIINEISTRYKTIIPVLISQGRHLAVLQDGLFNSGLNNLVAKHTSTQLIDETELIVTCHKLLQQDIFGVEKYLSNWTIKIHEHTIGDIDDKGEAVGALDDYLDRIDCYRGIKESVLLVADELLMNAIFNAPRDDHGQPKYAKHDRGQPLVLEPGEEVSFKFTCDGRYIALSVTDLFGSLSHEVIRKHLKDSFDDKPVQMKGGPKAMDQYMQGGGAGLGLHMVFRSVTQLIFNIKQGVSTEVIALFYARSGALAFKSSGRSLNLFIQNGKRYEVKSPTDAPQGHTRD